MGIELGVYRQIAFWNICVNVMPSEPFRPQWWHRSMSQHVQKRKAQPKRSIATPGDDRELGLWIDYELLRKHHHHTTQAVLHDPSVGTNNRYLELADLALGTSKHRRKPKGAASAK